MREFLNDDFLLKTATAQRLYHDFAKDLPIIDYHCHLPPDEIAEDKIFPNLTQVWLYGDHYKWRAMRANGVDESYCTGKQGDWEKFRAWAETVPYTMRNPLYHWTHLELRRYFGITKLLNGDTAREIYEECNEKLQSPAYSVRNLLKKMNVELVCTTDDPVDSLEHHATLRNDGFGIPILPAFRPDKAMNVGSAAGFNSYLKKLEEVSGTTISSFDDFLFALQNRHDFFAAMGCVVSDHGLEQLYNEEFTGQDINAIFNKIRGNTDLDAVEQNKFRSAMLLYFAEWDWKKGWVQQFHLGAMRNNNTRMLQTLGPDTGWDSIGDYSQGRAMSGFLNKLDSHNQLARTILYNLNPADNELLATMIGNFNDGSSAGKIQWGSAWWFLDQREGMTRQINTLSNMGLISRFVGMLTDSRSFLSFPRHEYFRRLLCNLFGDEVEAAELPNDMEWIGKLIKDICYYNAKNYFSWEPAMEKEAGLKGSIINK
ncbi:MAG: glucuronate isomerase [Chitinophagaceae bacterium]